MKIILRLMVQLIAIALAMSQVPTIARATEPEAVGQEAEWQNAIASLQRMDPEVRTVFIQRFEELNSSGLAATARLLELDGELKRHYGQVYFISTVVISLPNFWNLYEMYNDSLLPAHLQSPRGLKLVRFGSAALAAAAYAYIGSQMYRTTRRVQESRRNTLALREQLLKERDFISHTKAYFGL